MKNIKDFIKPERPVRIIQFGEGGFLRGFADWMIQKLNDTGAFCGSVAVVQPIRGGMCDCLSEQNCMYTHIIRSAEGVENTVIDVISHCVKPYEDFDAYLSLAENPDARFIISNTTEAGIEFREDDKITDTPPESFPAKLTLLLKRRFDLGLPGFILLPCELIDRNGDNLKRFVLQYAELWDLGNDFCRWVTGENIFCNTLVDRINTGYPKGEDIALGYEDNMLNTSETFHLWVIETEYDLERELPFNKVGLNVIVTPDALERYRTRKVRILNGAHTSMIPYAMLRGLETVKDCLDDEVMNKHLRDCLDEIKASLDMSEDEKNSYADAVLARFANPYIRHLCASISLNSISKFRVRVLPSILDYREKFGHAPKHLLFSFGMLLRFYRLGTPNDDVRIITYIKEHTTAEVLADKTLWGADLSEFASEVDEYANTSV
ncbi:MAG: tagaturonate reductase [Clostridia bacterium]|nr:tagaturonate reductase [Clostridia bacterium]